MIVTSAGDAELLELLIPLGENQELELSQLGFDPRTKQGFEICTANS